MKVIHLISGGDTGGARTHIHLLLKHLNLENEATLVCFMEGVFFEEAQAMGIPTVALTGKNLLKTLRTLRDMIRSGGYQVIHCHGSRGNLIGALLKPMCGLPLVTTVHSDPKLDYLGRPMARLVYGTLNAVALRRMDYYIGVSDSMRELLIARGFPADRVTTIYNGVEYEDAELVPIDRAAFFSRVGLQADEDSVVVGIAARLHPVKDISTLIRGFARAYAAHPELRLLIAGDGQDKAALTELTAKLKLEQVVCFAGWLENVDEFYRAIDINTLTSISETFPYAITEGARAHLPTVSTRVGGVPKLILPGETGFLIAPGDDRALGEHLSALAASAELRQALGDALYQKAKESFSAEATCRTQLGIYDRVLRAEEYRRKSGRCGVLICGAYGMSNAGDEAVLDALLAEMRSIDPAMPMTVLSRTPADTRARHGVAAIHMFNVPAFLRVMRRTRLFINGGGSLIQDVTSSRSLWYYLYTLMAAKHRGCRVMMYGCGVGPVNRRFNRRLAGRMIDRYVDAITLRESQSTGVLAELGVKRPTVAVASDPALFLASAEDAAVDALFDAAGLDKTERYFCLCLRRWTDMEKKAPLFAAAADYAREKYGLQPVLLSINPKQDAEICAQVAQTCSARVVTVTDDMGIDVLVGFIARMQAVLSMRLHALIFSASQAVPLIGVSYDPKVAAFLEHISQKNCVAFSDLREAAQLFPLIDAAAGADRDALRRETEKIMAIEHRNVETARRLLKEEDAQ